MVKPPGADVSFTPSATPCQRWEWFKPRIPDSYRKAKRLAGSCHLHASIEARELNLMTRPKNKHAERLVKRIDTIVNELSVL